MTVVLISFQSLPLSSPRKRVHPVRPSGEAVWSCSHRLKKNQNSEAIRQKKKKKQETQRRETAVTWSRHGGHIQPRLCAVDSASPHLH